MEYNNNFQIVWKTFKITKMNTKARPNLKLASKRILIFHINKWIDTKPRNVGQDESGIASITSLKQSNMILYEIIMIIIFALTEQNI